MIVVLVSSTDVIGFTDNSVGIIAASISLSLFVVMLCVLILVVVIISSIVVVKKRRSFPGT